jgi:hypothetical protein
MVVKLIVFKGIGVVLVVVRAMRLVEKVGCCVSLRMPRLSGA